MNLDGQDESDLAGIEELNTIVSNLAIILLRSTYCCSNGGDTFYLFLVDNVKEVT